jgi:hypothetical protein
VAEQGAAWHVVPLQKPEQQDEDVAREHERPFGRQPQTFLPVLLVTKLPWQHALQPSFFPFLPLGFLAGQRWPVGMQASLWAFFRRCVFMWRC